MIHHDLHSSKSKSNIVAEKVILVFGDAEEFAGQYENPF